MAIQGGNEQGGIFASINITPLTDIFLVLLIIFMVATAVTIESAAHVELPKLQAPTMNQPPKGITVRPAGRSSPPWGRPPQSGACRHGSQR